MSDRAADLERFYALMALLERRCGGARTLDTPGGRRGLPDRGVYFFFEEGELRADGSGPRVVRVGTHALRPSKSTLAKRLKQHEGNAGGSHPGGGNHRGSIFRLHVGTALLASGGWPADVQASWGRGNKPPPGARDLEYPLEQAVSACIGAMPFLWVEVDDEPSATSERGTIEAGSIALLSNYRKAALNPPSDEWLGHHADRDVIRSSGLWNVNHVRDPYDPTFLDVLERRIEDVATP